MPKPNDKFTVAQIKDFIRKHPDVKIKLSQTKPNLIADLKKAGQWEGSAAPSKPVAKPVAKAKPAYPTIPPNVKGKKMKPVAKASPKPVAKATGIVEDAVINLGKKAKDRFGKIIIYNITGTKKNDNNSLEIGYYIEKDDLYDLGHLDIDDIKINKNGSLSANPKKVWSADTSWNEGMGYE
tara:strand:- start:230 stop:772 length:543 start_codon:yes stop_codon:yes gene_type:complete